MSNTTLEVSRFDGPPAVGDSRALAGSQEGSVAEQNGPPVDLGHAVTRDFANYSKTKPKKIDYLERAHAKSGRGVMALAWEFGRLARGRGRLTFEEYVQYGVYDTNRYSREEQSQFISNNLHWPITHVCCDMTWQATTEDKWLCSRILARSGVRIPETVAVIDKTERIYPGTRKISTAGQLSEFLASPEVGRVFGKENRGICSLGAFLIQGSDKNAVQLEGHNALPHEAFIERFVGHTPYLLQKVVENHPFFNRFTKNLATVRVCVLLTKTGVKIPFAVLKLPSRENIADSFWRPGNLACNLDVRSGEILSARSRDAFGTTERVVHPETGARLLGEVLPVWDRVLDLVLRCAPIFYPVRYQSMDIAITREEPVLIEINTGGGFDLLQLAAGKGLLTDEVCDFFRSCGYLKV